MPRSGPGVYSKPSGTTPTNGDDIEAPAYNLLMDDIVTDLNTPRPIIAGGTGASSASAALASLGGVPSYSSRVSAISTTIPAPVIAISVLHAGLWCDYVYDAAGTALTTAGGRNWSPANEYTVKHFGAWGDDTSDDIAAFNAATAAIQPWQTLHIPFGNYRVSATWQIKNRYRSKIKCDGVIKPHGSFSDYLVWFNNDAGDSIVISMAQQMTCEGLTLDCEWKSRGVKIEKQYCSAFNHIRVWRPYGAGISCPMVQEVSMFQPEIISGKPRIDAAIASAAAWSAATTYTSGTYIRRDYAAFAGATAYTIGALVSSGGYLFRAILASTGATPTDAANADKWEQIPWEYFQATALAANLNKDPHDAVTDYTSRSGTAGNKFWTPVYADEAAWEIVSNGATVTIDNLKVFGFISRANAHNTIVRVDSPLYSFRPAKLEFYASQFHAITSVYISAHNADAGKVAAYGGAIVTPAEAKLVHLASSTGFKLFGGQLQTGDLARCKGLFCGTLGVSGNAAKTFMSAVYIEGTAGGDAQVGISIMPSVETGGANWVQSGVNIAMVGTNSAQKIDLSGETELFQSGTATILSGTGSIAVVFPRPFAATPVLAVAPKVALGGLSLAISALTNTGFTLTATGQYVAPMQTAAFTAAGGANQLSTYTHNFGTAADSFIQMGLVGDAGASYRVAVNTNTVNAIAIKAPAAPAVDCSQMWAAIWDAKVPVASQISWFAQVEPDA